MIHVMRWQPSDELLDQVKTIPKHPGHVTSHYLHAHPSPFYVGVTDFHNFTMLSILNPILQTLSLSTLLHSFSIISFSPLVLGLSERVKRVPELEASSLPMARFHCKSCTRVTLFWFIIFCSLGYFSVFASFEFQVGGTKGWVVPPANDSKIYNYWASENRFQVGNSIRFKYKKDSVMEVTEADYKKCNSTHPNLFSNTGNTVYTFDHPGSFYFISGASGHCQKGQRMIVKVMSAEEDSPSTGDSKSSGSPAAVFSLGVSKLVFVQFVLSYAAYSLFF